MLLYIARMARSGTGLGMINPPVPNGTCPNVVRRAFGRVANYWEHRNQKSTIFVKRVVSKALVGV